MIELIEFLKEISEPFMGSEIITLTQCYQKQWERFCVYKNELNSLIVRFDSRLLISGKVDYNELIAFARLIGISHIEGLKNDFLFLPENITAHSILTYENNLQNIKKITPIHEMKSAFKILSESDEAFKTITDYNFWLSDIRTRERNDFCSVFCHEDKTTASVMARGIGHSLIAQVATLPNERKKGLSSKLILDICAFESEKKQIPFVISKDKNTDAFYEHLGFVKREQKVIINLLDN